MFLDKEKAGNGWATIEIEGTTFPASYIEDVPYLLLDAALQSIEGRNFCVTLDAEGWDYTIVSTEYRTFVIEEKNEAKLYNFENTTKDDIVKDIIESISKNTRFWAQWVMVSDPSEADYEEELNETMNEYEDLLGKIKVAQKLDNMELGNLIFGHSRGEYQVDRETYQDMFGEFLEKINCDGYGCFQGNDGTFENEVFAIRPYYWGDDEEEMAKPNFLYKPDNLEIRWYKYPFRDSYSNKELTVDYLKEILNNCEKSINIKDIEER